MAHVNLALGFRRAVAPSEVGVKEVVRVNPSLNSVLPAAI